MDKDCTQPFPFELSNLQSIEFHRIVIAHGVSQKCRKYFNGGSGSLVIDNTIINGEHFSEDCQPFMIGQINPAKGYIHVFDEVTLDVILKKLDTVSDLCDYIMKKEEFLTNSDMSIFVAGEEELLAYYLQQLDEDGNHNFILPKENLNALALQEGFWVDFIKSPQFQSQLEANQISYSWDALIETFNKHILEDTQHYAYPHGVSNQEKIVKFLAKENRTRRRILAKYLYEILSKTQPNKLGARVMLPSQQGDPYYVFLLLPKEDKQSEDEYREMRREVLESFCMVTKYKFPEAEDIIGFASELGRGEYGSEDLIYLNARQWTEENQQHAKYFHDEVGLLRTINRFAEKEYVYPIEKKKRKSRKRHRLKKR